MYKAILYNVVNSITYNAESGNAEGDTPSIIGIIVLARVQSLSYG